MLSALSLDNASGSPVHLLLDPKRQIVRVKGLLGTGTLRDSKRVRPTAWGSINETHFSEGKLIAIEGEVASNVSVSDAYSEWRVITAPMIETLNVAPAALKWAEPGGQALQRIVKLDSLDDPELKEAAAILNYEAIFFSEDPRAYSQTLQTGTGTSLSVVAGGRTYPYTYPYTYAASGGGTCTAVVGGNTPTPPIFRVYGYCVNPQIVMAPNYRLALNGTVGAGDYLELNAALRTVKLVTGGTAFNRANMYDASNSGWFDLPVATNVFQLLAADFDGVARLDVLYRSAFT